MELNHSYLGSEHLLLGLLRERTGIAAQVLEDAGVGLENARNELLEIFGSPPRQPKFHTGAWGVAPTKPASELPLVPQYSDRVRSVLAAAYDVAKRQKSAELTFAHTAIALLEHERGAANAALNLLGFRREEALAALTDLPTSGTTALAPVDVLVLNAQLSSFLQSIDARNPAGGAPPGTHRLLVGILRGSPEVARVFAQQNITEDTLRDAVNRISG